MKTDVYTRIALAVIMACLVVIALSDVHVVRPLHAAQASQITQVDIVSIDGKTFRPTQVSVVAPALPVQAR